MVGEPMNHILEKIKKLRTLRGWSVQELAKRSQIPTSTISTWYRKNQMPSIPSLDKLSKGFGIPLSQLLAKDNEPIPLTPSQKDFLDLWVTLTPDQQRRIAHVIEIMLPGSKAE